MKISFLILLNIIFSFNKSPIQKGEIKLEFVNSSSIIQTSLAEQFYNKLEVKTNLPKILNKHIDRKASVRTEVPASLWLEIKNNIDYDSFKISALNIITDYYTNSELQTLIVSFPKNRTV